MHKAAFTPESAAMLLIAQASWRFSEAGLHEKRRDWTLASDRAQTSSCVRGCS